MEERSLRKMSDRPLLGRFLSSYLCYTKEKTVCQEEKLIRRGYIWDVIYSWS